MIEIILKIFRKIYFKVFKIKQKEIFNSQKPQFFGEESSEQIYNLLKSEKPCMISRLGNTEFKCVYMYKVKNENVFKKYKKYIIGDIDALDYTMQMRKEIENNAGFFPANNLLLDQFSKLMISEIQNIDILGSWLNVENYFKKELNKAKTIHLEDLNAYNHKKPWSRVLKGKKVLVIHPFVKSIKSQYTIKEKLFKNRNLLPDFDLITYMPVVSLAEGYKDLSFNNWFEALNYMKNDISKIDFDIAILGCGAYGLPLASFIKNQGKKAIHLGGSTQMLFGVLGKRWENEYDLSHIINEHWVRPLKEEVPKNFKKIEGGCYW